MTKALLAVGLLATPVSFSLQQPSATARPEPEDPRLHVLWQYFDDRDCPLRDSAAEFLVAADQNELDWRLLPSISMIESSGGKDYRNNNVFGWDSCRESFASVEAGIHFVASKLAKSKLYKGKNVDQKLVTYNPQPDYAPRVKAVMRALGPANRSRHTLN
ncbi:MAG TPA: hypothetical protein VH157_01495 [Bryobacteraceae bacterium]|jgi:hypothetical protein|nr:hypothetical protein [Bryobacteraceae bacterium]